MDLCITTVDLAAWSRVRLFPLSPPLYVLSGYVSFVAEDPFLELGFVLLGSGKIWLYIYAIHATYLPRFELNASCNRALCL